MTSQVLTAQVQVLGYCNDKSSTHSSSTNTSTSTRLLQWQVKYVIANVSKNCTHLVIYGYVPDTQELPERKL